MISSYCLRYTCRLLTDILRLLGPGIWLMFLVSTICSIWGRKIPHQQSETSEATCARNIFRWIWYMCSAGPSVIRSDLSGRAPDLVSPGVICLGGCCLAGAWCLDRLSWRLSRFGQSTWAELCGVAVPSWVLKREYVWRGAKTTRIQMFICDSNIYVWWGYMCKTRKLYMCE